MGLRLNSETVTHFANGTGSGVSVSAIVSREEPRVDNEDGRKTYQALRLDVADSVTCSDADDWTVDGVRHQTIKIGRAESGLRPVWVQAVSVQSQRESNARVL